MMTSAIALTPAEHRSHPLHEGGRVYSETNCWTDVLLEVVGALGMEPAAMLGATAAVDFEFDQWTFFKPTPQDLRSLYGLDVHEMQPGADLPAQVARRVEVGQFVLPEVDAWWLPDLAATDYHRGHTKTSIAIAGIDVAAEVLHYFHGLGFHELSGDDYRGLFALEPVRGPAVLPGYVEVLRPRAGPRPGAQDLRERSRILLAAHLAQRPSTNPFVRFGEQLEEDLPGLLAAELEIFHAYAFANARMAGAAFELLASHTRWLFAESGEVTAGVLDEVVETTKMLLFRLARRRVFDVAALVEPMALGWDQAMAGLDRLVADPPR